MPQPAEFQSQRSSVEGLDDAAKAFFEKEKAKAEAKRKALGIPEDAEPEPIKLPPDVPAIDRLARALGEENDPEPGTEPLEPQDRPRTREPEEPDLPPEDDDELAAGEDDELEAGPEISPETPIEMPDGSRVTIHELRRGFLRESDYTAKTTELANQRKLFESKVGEAYQAWEQRIGQAEQLAQELQANLAMYQPNQAQMEHLRQTNPGEYAARIEDQRRKQALISQTVQAKKQAQEEARRLWEEQRTARVPEERKALAARIPAFRRDFDREYEMLTRYALASDGGGLRPEEWDALDDHRHVTLVWKAREYDKATRQTLPAARKRLAGKPRSIRSGTQNVAGDTVSEELKVAMANLKANPESKQAQQDVFMARERAKRMKQQASRRRT